MALVWLDHVNIRTSNLQAMQAFYVDVLGLEEGPRPEFRFGGAWLYCGDKAAVHLVETSETPEGADPKIEHFAFRTVDVVDTIERLKARDVEYSILARPKIGVLQVNLHDPDGNHIELAFPPGECAHLPEQAAG